MKKVTFSMLFLFIATNLFAQADLKEGSHPINKSVNNFYIDSEWLPATIISTDNNTTKAKARYNVTNQEMEIGHNTNSFVLNPKNIKKVVISNNAFVPTGENFAFYQLLQETPQFIFLKSFKEVDGKLTTRLYKKNKKNNKLLPFKEEKTESLENRITTISQSTNTTDEKEENFLFRSRAKSTITTVVFDYRDKKILGSPFLDKDFINGEVYLKNEAEKILVPLQYNVIKDEFFLKYNNRIISLDPLQVKKVVIKNKVFIPYTDANLNNKYYQFIGEIKNKNILKYYSGKLVDVPYKPGISIENPKQKITIISNYFVENNQTGTITPLKRNKKSILSLFGNKKKQIEQYVKQNHINIKDSQNLTKLIKYYHTL